MLTIVVDAMGGDNAPACVIEGTIQALQESNNRFEIVLIGQSEKVEPLLASLASTQGARNLGWKTPLVV